MAMVREKFTFPQGIRVSPDGTGRGFHLDFDPAHVEFVAHALATQLAAFDAKYGTGPAPASETGDEGPTVEAPLPGGPAVSLPVTGATSPMQAATRTAPGPLASPGPHRGVQSPASGATPLPVAVPGPRGQPQAQFRPDLVTPPNAAAAIVSNAPNQPAIKAPPRPGAEMNPGQFNGGVPNPMQMGEALTQPPIAGPPPAPIMRADDVGQAYPAARPAPVAREVIREAPPPAAPAPARKGAVIGRIGPASAAQIAAARKQLADQILQGGTPSAGPPAAQAAVSIPARSPFLSEEEIRAEEARRAAEGEVVSPVRVDGGHVAVVASDPNRTNGLEIIEESVLVPGKGVVVMGVGAKRTGPIEKLPQPPIKAPPPPPPAPPSRLVDAHGRALAPKQT